MSMKQTFISYLFGLQNGNNVTMAKISSMESPSGTVEQGDIGHCMYIFIDIFIMMNSVVHNVIRKWYS